MASHAGQVLGARRLAYFRAFRRTHPHRLAPLQGMCRQRILREPLLHNLCVAPPGALFATATPTGHPAPCSRVVDVVGPAAAALRLGSPILAWLPDEWRSTLMAPEPAPPWVTSPCGGFVRSRAGVVHEVGRDGRVGASASGPAPPGLWTPACVVFCGMPGEPAPLEGAPPPPPSAPAGPGRVQLPRGQAYLVGPWPAVRLDPSLWGYGTVPLTHFVARRARERMLLLAAQGHVEGWVPGAGVPPRGDAWQARDGRFLGILARRVAPFGGAAGAGGGPEGAAPGQLRGHRRPREVSEVEPLFEAPWFHRPPKRAHVLDRVAARLGAGVPPVARADDTSDILRRAAPGAAPPPWRSRYAALWQAHLPRHLSHFGWQLLHDALPWRARLVAWGGGTVAELAATSACSAQACLASVGAPAGLETLEHAFVSCPVVAPVWEWLAGVWEALAGTGPPTGPGHLLGLGPSPWEPPDPALRDLWLLLRLATLHSIWVLRCTRDRLRPHGPQFGAADVATAVCAEVHSCVRVDWVRSGLSAWRPQPPGSAEAAAQEAALAAFRQRWCRQGALASVLDGPGGPSLTLVLSPALGDPDGVEPPASPVGLV
jgi:hypothetical protein